MIKNFLALFFGFILFIFIFLFIEVYCRLDKYFEAKDKKWLSYGFHIVTKNELKFDIDNFGNYSKNSVSLSHSSDLTFNNREFLNFSHTAIEGIEGLCSKIRTDFYDLISMNNTIDSLNEVLRQSNYYDKVYQKKPSFKFSKEIEDLVKVTKTLREQRFLNLRKAEQRQIIRLNRLLIEEIYQEESPKAVNLSINSYGFRGKEFQITKANTYRIVALGGSSTYGAFNDDLNTYPYLLEQILESDAQIKNRISAKKIEVINAGIPALSTHQVYYVLKNEVIPLNPDIIIIKSFYNHFSSFAPPVSLLQNILHFLQNRSVFFLKITEKWYSIKNKGFINANNYDSYLERIIKLAKSKNIEVVLVREPLLLNDKASISIDNPRYYQMNLKVMDQVGKRYNVIFADGATLSSLTKGDIFFDVVHLTDKGNRLLAEIIYNSIKEKLFDKIGNRK